MRCSRIFFKFLIHFAKLLLRFYSPGPITQISHPSIHTPDPHTLGAQTPDPADEALPSQSYREANKVREVRMGPEGQREVVQNMPGALSAQRAFL